MASSPIIFKDDLEELVRWLSALESAAETNETLGRICAETWEHLKVIRNEMVDSADRQSTTTSFLLENAAKKLRRLERKATLGRPIYHIKPDMVLKGKEGTVSAASPPDADDLYRRCESLLDRCSVLMPQRVVTEEIGDCLEDIHRRIQERQPRWLVRLKVAATFFWLIVHSIGYFLKASGIRRSSGQ